MWNDPKIQKLNPNLSAKLPNQSIVVGYPESLDYMNLFGVFTNALKSFSHNFTAKFQAANSTYSQMAPSKSGLWEPLLSTNSTWKEQWIRVRFFPFLIQTNSNSCYNYSGTQLYAHRYISSSRWIDILGKYDQQIRLSCDSFKRFCFMCNSRLCALRCNWNSVSRWSRKLLVAPSNKYFLHYRSKPYPAKWLR